MRHKLAEGVYEHVLSEELARAVTAHQEQGWQVAVAESDDVLRPEILARYVYEMARSAFRAVPGGKDEKLPRQVELANRVLGVLREGAKSGAVVEEDAVREGARLLMEARAPRGDLAARESTLRPHLALSESGLLVNGYRDYQIGVEVARGGELRVIASVYTGSTEKRALDELCALGAKVKVSYETAQTRLHAKAWLFRRATGLNTAYIGSSNLTHTALVEGLEWNVRLSSGDNGALVERVSAAFEQYWSEPEFIDYSPERDGERLDRALSRQRGSERASEIETLVALGIDFSPKPHQARILEALSAERARGHMKNLVVAATGTGKTWVSAFDYQRLRSEGFERLLFVAHREEILRQSQQVFQLVLGDPAFGERMVAGERPRVGRHVFASVQSLARVVRELDPEAYDVVIVDEFHHAAADTYTTLLSRLRPKVLVGLTATPERDGVLATTRARVALGAGQERAHGARLHRPGAPRVSLRCSLPRAGGRHAPAARARHRGRLPPAAPGLRDPAGSHRQAARARQRARIEAWLDVLGRGPRRTDIKTREGRLALMLFAALGNRRRPIEELGAALEEICAADALRRELSELLELLGDRARTQPEPIDPTGAVPLQSHASYTLFEVMAAYGATGKKGSLVQLQTGVYFAEAHGTDLLFVTLEKSEAAFSPTTRYEDYPISRTRFHWESQNTTAERSKTGQRYIGGTSRVVLFVRERHKDGRGETLPYVCLGPVKYVSHESERPMRIVWELSRAMPAWLYQVAKVAAG